MEKILFLLAGYPGVGKSTLLKTALEERLPIFGKGCDKFFQNTNLPEIFPEDSASGEERIARGTWFQEAHIPYLSGLEKAPEHCVIHFDLFSAILLLHRMQPVPSVIASHTPLTPTDLSNPHLIELIFDHVLNSGIFNRYDRIFINTCLAPWSDNKERWLLRARQLDRMKSNRGKYLSQHIFGAEDIGKSIYSAIHHGWSQSIRKLKPMRIFHTYLQNGRFSLRADMDWERINTPLR